MTIPGTKKISVFEDKLVFFIPQDKWNYLCENEFHSDNPSQEDIEAEFVTGTGITPKKKNLWTEATARFIEYIDELKKIKGLDINKMCRDLIEKEGIV